MAFVPALGIVLWFCTPWRVKVAGALLVLVAAAALVLSVPDKSKLLKSNPFTARLATATVDVNKTDRSELWAHAWKGFNSSPIFGVGFGNGTFFEPRVAGRIHEAHNTYLGLLAETGIAGCVLFVMAIGFFPAKIAAEYLLRKKRAWRIAGWAMVAAFANVMLAGIPVNVDNYRGLWILMGAGFAFCLFYLERDEDAASGKVAPA